MKVKETMPHCWESEERCGQARIRRFSVVTEGRKKSKRRCEQARAERKSLLDMASSNSAGRFMQTSGGRVTKDSRQGACGFRLKEVSLLLRWLGLRKPPIGVA